ncbi:hypothetical protein PHISCL_07551 [Aspergillus sclerotialis]|uniref:Rhodopsin domain-containing protein n=1 Tax=Aspergillus sclerotialis TaxID=2070753 RepID=A0A3A2ZT05_9EURO|nr:hypothetical protein PHISCL_07551 [Aspergillus sclerotialis]
MSIATANGYGNHFPTVDNSHFDAVMKSLYSAVLLYILGLYFSKLSLSIFIRNITPVSTDHIFAVIVQSLITVWAVVALFASAFACTVPRTWDYRNGQCIHLRAWRYYFCASNIVTDILIIIQAIFLICRIQAPLKRKAVFASIFLVRVLVVVAACVELALTTEVDVAHSADPTYDGYGIIIAMQVVQCSSIVTACWGQLKPFLKQLRSNGLRIEGLEYQHTTGKGSYPKSSGHDGSVVSQGNNHELVPTRPGQGNITTVSAQRTSDVDSQSSQVGIIRETRTWGITESQSS